MKPILCVLLLLGISGAGLADVKIKFKDIGGDTSTMYGNGKKVRINGNRFPGYVVIDSASGNFFLVDSKRNEIIKATPDEIGGIDADDDLTISLMPRGTGEKIAGYETGRYDLISNGMRCGTVYGSSELIKNRKLKRMFEAMQGMHRFMRSIAAGVGGLLSECQQATSQMAAVIDTSGFIMRFVDDKDEIVFDVLSLDTNKKRGENYYELPPGMKVVDIKDKMKEGLQEGQELLQQMPEMDQLMKQLSY